MTKALVPHGGGDGEVGVGDAGECGGGEGVEVTVTIAAKDLAPGLEVLYRKAKGVKLNGNEVVTGELPNREEITDYGWNN